MKFVAILPLAVLTGCGYIGNPLPPALDIPSPVTDLRAVEYGNNILVEFTIPPLTTEGLPLKSVRSVELFAGPSPTPFSADAWAESAKRYQVQTPGPGPASDEIPAPEWAGRTILLGVRATGPKGKISGWSNFVPLSVGTPLATPAAPKAESTKDGVRLAWSGSGPRYRVFRAAGTGQPQPIGESEKPEYLDASAQFGTHYSYYVEAIASASQWSVMSEPSAPITPADVFPPAIPAAVTAVASGTSIELAWERNTESDFKGYNVYRSTDGGPFEKIASSIVAPVYSDTAVQPGRSYRYAISSVDLLGNESARSEPVTAMLQ